MHLTKSTDMAAVVRKKQDDKYLQVLRELVTSGGGNRQCFDCGQKGPTYVNMTIGSFVCTRCSGVLRGLTPPHRVKSISMATFTQDDVDYIRSHGNDECAKTWLGLWDPKRAVHQDQRELMIDKYERKRYYLEPASPLKSLTNAVSLKSCSTAVAAAVAATSAGASITTTTGTSTSQQAAAAGGSSSAHKSSNGDGGGHADLVHISNGSGSGGHNGNDNNNKQRSFQLTPPSTQRTTMNGLHKACKGAAVLASSAGSGGAVGSTAISRPQHHLQQNLKQQQNGYSQSLQDAFMQKVDNNINNISNNNNNNELSVLHMTTNRMSESSSATSVNGFGTDADFVADFGSASIFDATNTTTGNHIKIISPPLMNGGAGATSSNGYARIQPLKQRQQQQQLLNGNSSQSESIGGNSTSENFADFEHAPIFNAAANYQFIRTNVIRRYAGGSDNSSPNDSKAIPPPVVRVRAGMDSQRSSRGMRQPPSPSRGDDAQSPTKFKQSDMAEESGDIRQATVHSDIQDKNIKSPDKLSSPKILTPGFEATNKTTTQKAVDELTSQLNAPQIFTFAPSVTQAEYSGYCPQPRCTELTIINNNQTENLDPNQDQGGFCGGNIPQIDWSRYANNTPCWPPGSSTCLQGNQTAADPMIAEAVAAKLQNPGGDPNQQQQSQQGPTPFCPEVKFCAPMSCPIPCLPPPCSPRVCPLPPNCAATANGDQQQAADATVAGLSYGPIPQQTIINTAQTRSQNNGGGVGGCGTQTEPCLEPTPSYSLPIPNNNTSRIMNNQHNNSQSNNNNLSSTPSEDRYAALKDLDEQLRESKAAATVVSAYGVETFANNSINNGINPFNHQQVNPFQAANHGTSPSTAQNYFGQMTVISNSNGNGNHSNGITSQQATQYYNYSNGIGNATRTAGTFPHTVMATGPSGCGFALGTLQSTAISATGAGGGGAFNNPFSATGAMQTNNPFL
ncbi:uncharacterized protein DDB_G0283357 isoform X2 [Eurosta solidaginis]|uniref:uncharacterized protein DDB_G0283357 isoform X2 n=1 Tax=Eurosta solidaginis TaxID=178769 RepID=UPI003530D7C9